MLTWAVAANGLATGFSRMVIVRSALESASEEANTASTDDAQMKKALTAVLMSKKETKSAVAVPSATTVPAAPPQEPVEKAEAQQSTEPTKQEYASATMRSVMESRAATAAPADAASGGEANPLAPFKIFYSSMQKLGIKQALADALAGEMTVAEEEELLEQALDLALPAVEVEDALLAFTLGVG